MGIVLKIFYFSLFIVLLGQETIAGGDSSCNRDVELCINRGFQDCSVFGIGETSGCLKDVSFTSARTLGNYVCSAYSDENCDGDSFGITQPGANYGFTIKSVKCEC
ncbi:CLUMA_CG000610, isoform A [Clunio marinus]|uniref:CLUMA_CG000610, isoform A n=1 Tax=Clunio marinus TaxID=568069 RepID=A0A1J1HFZ2_9DIPT|nr:CLUMA_CG000610, isoform A [Clunio marinus]